MEKSNAAAAPLLSVRGLTKVYPGVRALDDVSIDFAAGEVHALVGENGAGKSTLIKIVSGHTVADGGDVLLDGRVLNAATPAQAQAAGIRTIYQDALLAPDLSVAENIYMGHLPVRHGLVDRRRLRDDARCVLAGLGVDIDVNAEVGSLSPSRQQFVAVARAVAQDARVLIMDEPTAVLAQEDVEHLFALIDRLRSAGCAILYITHRLGEVFRVADRVSAMRDGRVVTTTTPERLTRDELVSLIVGRKVDVMFPERSAKPGDTALSVEHIAGTEVEDVSFGLREGEVLGMYGLAGSGASEVGRLLFGASPRYAGRMSLWGNDLANKNPRDSVAAGFGYVPADRKAHGLLMERGVDENITISSLDKFSRLGVLDLDGEKNVQSQVIERLGVKTPAPDQLVGRLSGGNQQKVVLGRWLASSSKVLIFDEPTQGVDVGARYEIYKTINDLTSQGTSVLVISSDMEELVGISDRILVMHEGHVVRAFDDSQSFDREAIMRAASGLEA